MRVLILHSVYGSGHASGENRVVRDEIRLLEQAGHEVLTCMPEVPTERIPAALAGSALWSRRWVERAADIASSERVDVVHVHNVFPNLSPAVIRSVARTSPVVVTLHNFRLLCLPATLLREGVVCEDCVGHGLWRGVLHGCYRDSVPASAALAASLTLHRVIRTFDDVDLFLSVSGFVRDKHVAAGFDRTRIRKKPNFVMESPQRIGPGDYFLILGRLSIEKGLRPLLRGWGEAPLEIAGDGPLRGELQSIAPAHIVFHGTVDPQRASALMLRARALLVPSRCYEGQPRSILEAFAAGVPVIGSRIGGLPEVIENEVNGLLIEPDDYAGWQTAVERLLDDAESQRLGAAAYEAWKSDFTPGSGLRNLEAAYSEAIAMRTGR